MLTAWHRYFEDAPRLWRVTEAGVEYQDAGLQRTPGPPTTVTRIWRRFEDEITTAARRALVPVELLIATIATESNARLEPWQVREEPGYVSDTETPAKISVGLCHILLATASHLLDQPVSRSYLSRAGANIALAALYIRDHAFRTALDPPLVAADYNAGNLIKQNTPANPWRLRQYPLGTGQHCDRFCKWLGDAIALRPVARQDWAWWLAAHPVLG